ncbi:antibiotic biosynthesis monooxygenase [Dehalobacter sp. DCM]|uniref:putative quinol monooxygenase n=1 Tax=Dehalobacter sp. DCM TaxID=2907827 RepID=UPI00308163E5|nr:antibiotic biosynthesis monooxygenase [Dehalobacter sp. DCM]
MIKLIFRFTVKEDKIDEFIAIGTKLVASGRKDEGCISMQLLRDSKLMNVFAIIDEWASQEALDKHSKNPVAIALMPLLDETLEKFPPDGDVYSVVI